MTKVTLPAETVLSREELGDMYYELRGKFHSYFSPWSNMLGPQGDPEATKKEITDKMAAIEKELGEDFLLVIRLKKENRQLEKHLKDQVKNNDELEERVERLEKCVKELHDSKGNRFGVDEFDFRACNSKIPDKSHLRSSEYGGSLLFF